MRCFRWVCRVPGRKRWRRLPVQKKWTRLRFSIISSLSMRGLMSRSRENRSVGKVFVSRPDLQASVVDARMRTLDLVCDLSDEQFRVPPLRTINPFLWEIGHVAYFQDYWVLRHAAGRPPIRADGDGLYDSAKVAHDTRWHLPLPSRAETVRYMEEVRDRALDYITGGSFNSSRDTYFVLLSVFHEDMHDEAFLITRQTLGYPVPPSLKLTDAPPAGISVTDDVSIPGGEYTIGSTAVEGFIFDNEKWAHAVNVPAFRIARSLVTQKEFLN